MALLFPFLQNILATLKYFLSFLNCCRIFYTTKLQAANYRSDMRHFLCTEFKECRDSVSREARALLVGVVNLGYFFRLNLQGGHHA